VKAVRLHEEILARERLHAQVQQEQRATQERLRSLNLIAGSVAHDLNNALGPLVALPETIRQELEVGTPASEEVYEDLESIRLAGLRASHTIRDLFVLGRPEQAPKTRFDLNRLLRSHGEELSRLCGQSSIRFRLDPDPGPLVVRASKSQVISAVSNLIQNAVDAIADRGVIVVRARARRVPDESVGGHLAAGEYAVIEVVDSGSGIAADLLPHIHEPFFSASARKTGSKGLGLAIVQRLMRDSGGYLDVRSELGQGSTFSLYFPLLVEDSARSSVPRSRPRGGKERILVVDDEPVQLRTASRILTQLGYDVAVAGSGEEAVTVCSGRGERDAFDLLIVDMVMPGGLNGLATVAQVRRRRPVQRALIASGYAPQHLSSAAAREGLPWLSKPYTLAGLAAAVRNAIRRDSRAPDDPPLASERSG
jgi:nitrogen-specific signal transduction histidine kinase/ActR/RegA family two-component response regulator